VIELKNPIQKYKGLELEIELDIFLIFQYD